MKRAIDRNCNKRISYDNINTPAYGHYKLDDDFNNDDDDDQTT